MINCNTSYCSSDCEDSSLDSRCIILEGDICFVNTCEISSNGNSVVVLQNYINALCAELTNLKNTLKCMTDLYCVPQCNLLISNINLTT